MTIKKFYKKEDLERSSFYEWPTTSSQSPIGDLFRGPLINKYNNNYPNKNYTYLSKLGDGSASRLYLAKKDKDDNTMELSDDNTMELSDDNTMELSEGSSNETTIVVVKKIPKYEEWRTELLVLDHIKNKSDRLLSIVDFYESNQYAYIICEQFKGFDLFEHINLNIPYKPHIASKLVKDMLLCIKDCHDLGVAHLDIKCENFMVVNKSTVLIDFGHAEIVKSGEKFGITGTYGTCPYLCPEGFDRVFSYKSDIWSMGICVYLLLVGDFPFNCRNSDREYEKAIINNDLYLEPLKKLDRYYYPICLDFITQCLQHNPRDRPSVEQLLEHSFIRDF